MRMLRFIERGDHCTRSCRRETRYVEKTYLRFFAPSGAKSSDSSTTGNDPVIGPQAAEPCPPKTPKKSVYQKSWQKDWPWLDTNDKGDMLCNLCIANKMSNAFTTGCVNFRTSTLSRHADTNDHKLSVIAKSQGKSIEKVTEKIISHQAAAVTSAIDTVYWLAKENIATDKYPSLLELLDKEGCSNVKNLNVGGNASYRSITIAQEIQQAIADTLMADIIDELKISLCVAILTDESTDISITGKLIVYPRFVTEDFQLKSHFLGNFNIGEKDATTITNTLTSVLAERGISVDKILCLGSDGASVMTGVKNGVVAQLKQRSPFLVNIHCVAHRLALCTSQAASKLEVMQQYKQVLTNLYSYFKHSSVRSSRLSKVQELFDQPQLKMREMHDIRWFSFYNVLEGIYKSWNSLVIYFDSTELSKDPKATNLHRSLLQYKFPAMTWMLMDIIPIITALNLVFQKDSLDIAVIKPIVSTTISKLEYLKSNDGHYKQEFKNLLNDKELFGHVLTHKTQQEQMVESAMEKFIDILIENMNKRFPNDSVSVISAFDALAMRDISFIPQSEIDSYGSDKLNVLLDHYSKPKGDPQVPGLVDEQATRNEYSLLKPLVLQQKHPRDQLLVLWQIIFQCYKEQFPNLIKLAAIALTLPVQTAICERGFSCQNSIKTAHRNRLSESTLQTLMTINIEGPCLKNFDAARALEEFKTRKQRRIFQKLTFK